MMSLPTKMNNFCTKDNCLIKGTYLGENILYYIRLSCDQKIHTQLNQNEYSKSTKEEWIMVIFDKL